MKKTLLMLIVMMITFTWSNPLAPKLTQVKDDIKKGLYKESVAPLERLIKKNWDTKEGEEAVVILAEVLLRIDNVEYCRKLVRRFKTYYSGSQFESRIDLIEAKIFVGEGEFYKGVAKAMNILFLTKQEYSYAQARELIVTVLKSNVLHEEELLRLVNQYPVDSDIIGTMFYRVAAHYAAQNKTVLARTYYTKMLRQFPKHELSDSASAKLTQLKNSGKGTPSLLVVTPLSGEYAGIGRFVVQGAILAIEQYNKSAGDKKLSYRVIDTKAHPAETVERVSQAMEEDNIVGVVGPVMSPEAAALAGWLSQKYPQVPMVTPTATDDGIARLGKNIFQINTPPSYLAQSIARYSIKCLGHKEYAILSPNSDYGAIMAENFKTLVEKYGGKVLFQETYEEGNADYRATYEVLRLKKYYLDREREYISGKRESNKIDDKEQSKWLADSTIAFDALFIAASDAGDAAQLASQASFNKIKTHLLGSSGWYNKKIITEGKKYVEGAYFSTSLTDHDDSGDWEAFRKAYTDRWETSPDKDRVSGLTYNAARFILWAVQSGESDIVLKMRRAKTVNGVYGTMNFNTDEGYNDSRTILKIDGAKFVKAQECSEF